MAQRGRLIYPPKVADLSIPYLGSLKAYLLVTKPASVSLLVFTGVVGFAVASEGAFPPLLFLFLLIALALGCAGANTLTCFIDRDIDAVMERTKNRPIPSHQVSPGKALIFGSVLMTLALGLSLRLNLLTFVIILAGIVNNVVMYSIWTKRKTPLNIIVGSLAGGLPAMAGYAAYANSIGLAGLLLAAIVVVWIPVHIWSIALRYKQDYIKAKVPMLSGVVSEARTVKLIALSSVLLVVLSLLPAVFGLFGLLYLYSAAILGVVLMFLSLWLAFKPVETRAWVVFKTSSVYLGLLFLSVLLDSLFYA